MNRMSDKLKFGDIVVNEWAAENNPHRVGVVVEIKPTTIRITDMEGRFWEAVKKDHRLKKTGTVLRGIYAATKYPKFQLENNLA